MPKKPNITDEQITAAVDKADELFFELQHIADEVRAGRCDDIPNLAVKARRLLSLTRIAADATGVLLHRQAMHDDTEALRKDLVARLQDQKGA